MHTNSSCTCKEPRIAHHNAVALLVSLTLRFRGSCLVRYLATCTIILILSQHCCFLTTKAPCILSTIPSTSLQSPLRNDGPRRRFPYSTSIMYIVLMFPHERVFDRFEKESNS